MKTPNCTNLANILYNREKTMRLSINQQKQLNRTKHNERNKQMQENIEIKIEKKDI